MSDFQLSRVFQNVKILGNKGIMALHTYLHWRIMKLFSKTTHNIRYNQRLGSPYFIILEKLIKVGTFWIRHCMTYLYLQKFPNQPLPPQKCHFGVFHGVETNFIEFVVKGWCWFWTSINITEVAIRCAREVRITLYLSLYLVLGKVKVFIS